MLRGIGCKVDSMFCRVAMAYLGLVRDRREDQSGQGTVEYAILVGVLVVIAIVAVLAFRDNLQALWDSISTQINAL